MTLANGGILFLDELAEFRKDALEGLREPLQNGEIHLGRVGARTRLPARFWLIAAMNPCPCGHSFGSKKKCTCPNGKPRAYRGKISGPLYDRIDLSVILSPPCGMPAGVCESGVDLSQRISQAHAVARERYGRPHFLNGDADVQIQEGPFGLEKESREWLHALCQRESVSFRSLHKTVRIARTLADLESAESIRLNHLQEAWGLRCRDYSTIS